MKPDAARLAAVSVNLGGLSVLLLQATWQLRGDQWDALPFAALYHGALWFSALGCALAWRGKERDLRVISTAVLAVCVMVWMDTWLEPLRDLVAWVGKLRHLWLPS
jgi:hypothetical protein